MESNYFMLGSLELEENCQILTFYCKARREHKVEKVEHLKFQHSVPHI